MRQIDRERVEQIDRERGGGGVVGKLLAGEAELLSLNMWKVKPKYARNAFMGPGGAERWNRKRRRAD